MPAEGTDRTVLIVDDDPDVCRFVVMVLTGQGYRTIGSRTGREALSSLRGDIDVLVTDLSLPDIDGVTLIERVKAGCPDAGVVLMSGYAEVPRARLERLGIKWTFLPKPFPIQKLVEAVRRVATHAGARAA